MSEYKIEEVTGDRPRTHLVISPTVLVTLLSSAVSLGIGVGAAANNFVQNQQEQAYVRDYTSALQRIDEVERKLPALRQYIDTRTSDRWLAEDHKRYARGVESRLAEHERALQKLEACYPRACSYRFNGSSSNGSR